MSRFRDAHGQPSPLPCSPEDARRTRQTRYISDDVCEVCGKNIKYTATGGCYHCALLNSIDLFAFSVGAMNFIVVPEEFNGGEISTNFRQGSYGDRVVSREYYDLILSTHKLLGTDDPAPTNSVKANERGLDLWVRAEPCPTHGHFGIRTLKNYCYFCEQRRDTLSPRKQAISDGLTWYTPSEPCHRCGTLAERNVHNGSCRGCNPGAETVDNRKTPDSIIMEKYPEMVIDRDAAKRLRMKIYRTGKPCRKGHSGFRYVSTGNCIECLRGLK